jgi:DNA-binding transcriptional LysR family regulator
MPEPAVQQDLAAGRLVQLDLPDARGGFYALRAIYRTDSPPRTAAAWMIQRFSGQAI